MRPQVFRLLIAVTTCALGIATGTIWSTSRIATVSGHPCHAGMAVVEQQPDAPIGITILSANCVNGFAYINVTVEGKTSKLIKGYELHNSKAHHGIVDFDAHGSTTVGPSELGMTAREVANDSSGVGERLDRGWFREPFDEVRFSVWSVTFADGTKWHHAPGATW